MKHSGRNNLTNMRNMIKTNGIRQKFIVWVTNPVRLIDRRRLETDQLHNS